MPKPTQAEVAAAARSEPALTVRAIFTRRLNLTYDQRVYTWHEIEDALEEVAAALYTAPPAKPAGELPQLLGDDDLVANMRGIAAVVEETLGMTRMKCASGWIDGDGIAVVMRHAADELESAYALRALRERA